MKSAFRTYSDVLLFRSDVIRTLLASPRGIAYALKLFVIVLLIAGLGVWFGLPNSLAQPTLSESADRLISSARDTGQAVVAPVVAALTSGKIEAASQAVVSKVQETVNPIVTQLNTLFGGLIAGADTVDRLLQKSSVTADEIERVVSNARDRRSDGRIARQSAIARGASGCIVGKGRFDLCSGTAGAH
ncbi:MAG: hypothetical protein IPK16_15910 [Anaerolineales bacterium]|nr:hypothetical protein [Anaerolineales bacterium]